MPSKYFNDVRTQTEDIVVNRVNRKARLVELGAPPIIIEFEELEISEAAMLLAALDDVEKTLELLVEGRES